jgi:hypothetical protein
MILLGFGAILLLFSCIYFDKQICYILNPKQIIELVYFHLFKKKESEIKEKIIPYEYKYIDKYDYLKPLFKDSIFTNNNSYIIEFTPDGNVIMYYNKEHESFFYYCDKKEILYKYLETVARKYTIQNKCFDIFVDMREELNKEIIESNDNPEQRENVFAKFKKYKTTKKRSINETNKQNKKMRIKENANKYSYKGKINDFNFFEKSHQDYYKNKTTLSNHENISYSSFKDFYLN